jgi:hypothetical protein
MRNVKLLFCVVLVISLFGSCQSDDEIQQAEESAFEENFGSVISRDFIGRVVDLNDNPIQDVTITIGSSTVQTDENGVFILNNADVFEKFAYVTAKKAGYIDGSRSLIPTDRKNNVAIMLLPNAPIATVQSGVASEVSFPSGTKVVFDGAFQEENGNDYSGSVQVAMFHLKPSDERLDKLMPGMLYAQTENNEEALLETFGMLHVELRGSAGQILNIKTGHVAEITFRIDDNQVATAPTTIPLWHFDQERGYWKQEGLAAKTGNKYVGQVSHFSWWNADVFLEVVNLTVTIVDPDGNPISNLGVGLVANGITSTINLTNNLGMISGIIPPNQTITLNVYAFCGTLIYTTTIGPFSTNTILPNIIITNMTTNSSIEGKLLKCDATNVSNGYVLMFQNNHVLLAPVTNGNFSFNEIYCPGNVDFSLIGYDFDNLQQTESIEYEFRSPRTFVGNLMTCNSVTEFVSYQVDNGVPIFYTLNVYGGYEFFTDMSPYGILFRDNISGPPNFSFWMRHQLPGIYTNPPFTANSSQTGAINSAVNTNDFEFVITKSGPIGDYIDMTFDGTYNDANNVTHRLRATVHARRDH